MGIELMSSVLVANTITHQAASAIFKYLFIATQVETMNHQLLSHPDVNDLKEQ